LLLAIWCNDPHVSSRILLTHIPPPVIAVCQSRANPRKASSQKRKKPPALLRVADFIGRTCNDSLQVHPASNALSDRDDRIHDGLHHP
jgi:hypothetical protein